MTFRVLLFNIIQGILCLLLFAQCAVSSRFQPTNQFSPGEVNRHYMTSRLEIFFWGEEVPTEPYIVVGNTSTTAYEEPNAIRRLRERAMEHKADGIIVKGGNTGAELETWNAVIIKYARNFEGLQDRKRMVQVATYDSIADDYLVVGSAQYDLMGTRGSIKGNEQAFRAFYDYHLDHLLYEKSNFWTTRFSTNPLRFIKRSYTRNGILTKFVNFTYGNNEITEAKVTHKYYVGPRLVRSISTVLYTYNEKGQEIQRVVKCNKHKLNYSSTITYNEAGLPVQETITRLDKQEAKPFMKIMYRYYNNLEQVQVITP